uniref:PWWP domain-containing protein n=1 Tax=Timema tahoe TaxID=61484 RepID=A0A7R9IBY5_9NEOP|nr:unnamed protein product [Timema tahoe]
MCDQTEMPYTSGNVVWTKCQGIWWPGIVMKMEELPEEITRDFVKMPLLAVKFFNEDSYSYIRNHDSICLYNCRRKMEFIKKGLGLNLPEKTTRIQLLTSLIMSGNQVKDHTNNKKKDSLQKFIEDIKLAENITGGDPDILESPSMEGLVFHFKNHTKSKHTLDYSCKKDTLIPGKHKRSKQTKASSNAKDKFARRTQSPKPSTSKEGISPPEVKRSKKEETAREETNLIKPRNPNNKNKSETTPLKNKSENADKKLASKNLFGKRKWQKSSNEFENKSNKKKCEVEIRERLLADWDVDDATEQEEISPIKETSKPSPPNNTSESPLKQKATDCFDFDDSAGSILDSDLEERARKFAETRRIPTIPVLNTNCKFSPKHRLENSTSISEVLPSTQKHVTQEDNESRLKDTIEHFEDAVNSILSETIVPTIPKIPTTICANDRSLNDTNNSTSSIVSCVDEISSHSSDPIQNICEDDQPVVNSTVKDSIQVKTAIDEIKNMDETKFVDRQTQDGHQSNITGQCPTNTDSADDVDSEINHVHGLKNGEDQNSLKCGKNNDFINKSDEGGGSVSESAEHIRSKSLIKTSLPAQRDIFGAQAKTKKKHTSQDVLVDALKKDNYIIETKVLDDPIENPDDHILSTESSANKIQSHDSLFVESKVIVNMPIDVSRKDALTEGGEAINQDENPTNPVQNKERDIYSRRSHSAKEKRQPLVVEVDAVN